MRLSEPPTVSGVLRRGSAGRVGRYELLFRLGAGGMAEVFAARVTGANGFDRVVAVKRILPHLSEDHALLDMFLDEVRLASRIEHPHVVQVLDSGRDDDGLPYLVMELVRGLPLATLQRHAEEHGPLPVPVAVEWMAQTALGLHAAHQATSLDGAPLNIVHRDVSPQNVLVDVQGRARVGDFGVAHATRRLAQTEIGAVKGKAAYLAPEQVFGEPVDRRTDVFALGVVLWECLAGQRLFQAETSAAIVDQLLNREIPSVRALRTEVSRGLAAVVARAVEREAEDRFPDALSLAEALRGELRTQGGTPSVQRMTDTVRRWGGERLTRLEARLRPETWPGMNTRHGREGVAEDDVTRDAPLRPPASTDVPTPVMPASHRPSMRRPPPRTSLREIAPWLGLIIGMVGLAFALGSWFRPAPPSADPPPATAARSAPAVPDIAPPPVPPDPPDPAPATPPSAEMPTPSPEVAEPPPAAAPPPRRPRPRRPPVAAPPELEPTAPERPPPRRTPGLAPMEELDAFLEGTNPKA
jgi:serine/threonine protein kinase